MHHFISGIQQVGIGVENIRQATLLYKALFGMDVLIFDDTSEATLMTKYTGGKVYNRQAILTMNLAGGGGFEIWQYKNRQPSIQQCQYGDIGIYATKIKCKNIAESHLYFSKIDEVQLTPIQFDPINNQHFWLKDKFGNTFNIVQGKEWFSNNHHKTGGVIGVVIGVSDIDRSLSFYKDVLGISTIVYDVTNSFTDNDTHQPIKSRRVLLRKPVSGVGAFNKLLGDVEIELVQRLDAPVQTIFSNRFWGDCGFIHVCFDVLQMDSLKQLALQHKVTFTVDSNESFAMQNAAGRFCYAEDPDGTLIELVETHKVPIYKKWGIYLNLQKRNPLKPLPNWMIGLLGLSKVK
ncbi:VOC family protein [Ferruginibacter yonginensis]|uniref:VOC family protein n=1 Tax=Ferruginibacter yonginensis TaxID=1310416 RepID=A0ABV8QQR7_9BACT